MERELQNLVQLLACLSSLQFLNTANIKVTLFERHRFPIHTTGNRSSTEVCSNTAYEEISELSNTQHKSAPLHYITYFCFYICIENYPPPGPLVVAHVCHYTVIQLSLLRFSTLSDHVSLKLLTAHVHYELHNLFLFRRRNIESVYGVDYGLNYRGLAV
jgi:hypothetical protein